MVHSNYKHFEGCRCPTIADSNPAQADGAHPAAPAEHCGLAGLSCAAAATHTDLSRNAPPVYRVVS
jgi:hypothetical protein